MSIDRHGTTLPAATLRALDDAVLGHEVGVVVVCGFPASGKSSAARYLADKLSAVVFDKDGFAPDLEQSVMGVLNGQPYDRDSEMYRTYVGPYIYDALMRNALVVAQRCPVVVDAPVLEYVRTAAREGRRLSDYLAAMSPVAVPVKTIWLVSDPETIRQRMVARGAQRDASKLAEWESYRETVLESGVDAAAKDVVDVLIRN